jgi:hypothetical protein
VVTRRLSSNGSQRSALPKDPQSGRGNNAPGAYLSCAHQTDADKPCTCIIWWAGESEDLEFRVRRIGRRGRQGSTSGPACACHSYTVAMVKLVD